MKVWVVMGNDYPDAVFDSEEAADAYCKAKKKEQEKEKAAEGPHYRRIYWRSYEFTLNNGD